MYKQLPLCTVIGHVYVWVTLVGTTGRRFYAFQCSYCGHIRMTERIMGYHA